MVFSLVMPSTWALSNDSGMPNASAARDADFVTYVDALDIKGRVGLGVASPALPSARQRRRGPLRISEG